MDPQPRHAVTGVVIALNEADRIGRCITSLRALCTRVVVLDSGSRDDTVAVARAAFCGRRYRLVEAAAGAVAEAVLEQFRQVVGVRVTVHKPHAPIAATFTDVGVTIARARRNHG